VADGEEHPALRLTPDELGVCQSALNEVLHGPEAIEDWEFQTRMGVERDEAIALLARLRGARSQDPLG